MQYQSTRDKNLKASSAQAILNGLAPDGGLYTMSSFDEVKFDYTTVSVSYTQLTLPTIA